MYLSDRTGFHGLARSPPSTQLLSRRSNGPVPVYRLQVTCNGCRHLDLLMHRPLSTDEFVEQFVQCKVATWCEEVEQLTTIAASQQQAAYSTFTQGLQNKWSFLCRASSIPPYPLEPLEHAISDRLISAITGQAPPGTTVRCLLFPCLAGLGDWVWQTPVRWLSSTPRPEGSQLASCLACWSGSRLLATR